MYAEPLTIPEFRAATLELIGKSSIPAEKERVERHMSTCLAAGQPMLVGLRTASGEWLAVLGGWCEHDRAIVVFQLNRDQEHRTDSLSVVLRGYLIESLIRRGFQSIVFVGGVGEPLKRYCRIVPTVLLYLDKPNAFLRPARLLELAARLAPSDLELKTVWLANPNLRGADPLRSESPMVTSPQKVLRWLIDFLRLFEGSVRALELSKTGRPSSRTEAFLRLTHPKIA
jgi:hypothetical protein